MSECYPEGRARVQRAARTIRDAQPTVVVHEIEPENSAHDTWTLEATLADVDGLPPEVLTAIGTAGLTLHPRPQQGDFAVAEATA